MRHSQLERWSRGSSSLHTLDARAKLLALIVFLIAVATTPSSAWRIFTAYAALLLFALVMSRLPWAGVAQRALIVLPFSAGIALAASFGSVPGSALSPLSMVTKSLLSVIATILVIGTTPWTALVRALAFLRLPRELVLALEFLYRYLFVIGGEVERMRLAAQSRGGTSRLRNPSAAAGMIGLLFARSWERAEGVHHAMLARGFAGSFPVLHPSRFRVRDGTFITLVMALLLCARLFL